MRYTAEQKDFLKRIIPGRCYAEIVRLFSDNFGVEITTTQVNSFCKNNKVKTGRTGKFQKGHIPYNKGKKGVNGVNSTTFKKGNRPKTWKPVGSERVDRKEGFVSVKVAEPNVWKHKHRVIWEKANGPIPKGSVVLFGNGDRTDFSLENLILVSRGELVVLNKRKLIQDNIEGTQSAVLLAKLLITSAKAKNRKK